MRGSKLQNERLYIVLYGAVNSGKSTLFNQLIREERSVVSSLAGTTTDAVYKAIELPAIGPAVLVDTPGVGDDSVLGTKRMQATRNALKKADIVLCLLPKNQPVPKALTEEFPQAIFAPIYDPTPDMVLRTLQRTIADKPENERSITGNLVQNGDLVMLVMPQDKSAPKGRLILPQVQVIRELLDKQCEIVCVQPAQLKSAFSSLKKSPNLVITDSQVFLEVERICPSDVPLTSFSVLMSAYKGSLNELLEGARVIPRLKPDARILIAEACSHIPTNEDIGRVKLPSLLRRKLGNGLLIDHVNGQDFPDDLTPYDLIIHCGACMFNRTHLLNRQNQATQQAVPMTNYGIAIAQLLGILDRVALP